MSHVFAWWESFVHVLVAISDQVYVMCNQLVGHFWLLDNFISLPLYNQLVKAALLGGCFMAVWHKVQDEDAVRRSRRILLVTLVAAGFVVTATKIISHGVVMPRPYVQSQTSYQLDAHDQLVESPRLPYRVPLDAKDQARYRQLLRGDIVPNDLDAFPSDHAAFYVAVAAGVFMASRAIGMIALGWTFLVLIASRVIAGQHSPLDVTAGALVGFGILWVCQYVVDHWLKRFFDPLVSWTLRHQALATLIVFLALFEVSNTLQDLGSLIETGHALTHYFF
jgi:membrane-associated phospholipid phosphatase